MKKLTCMLGLLALVFTGSTVLAEPITYGSDSLDVAVDIAKWVWIEYVPADGYLLDFEAAASCAQDTKAFRCGHNCDVRLSGQLTPPPGAPGIWKWWYTGDGQSRRLLLQGPASYPDLVHGPGVYTSSVSIRVTGIGITDHATTYEGGTMTIIVDAL